MSDHNRLQAVAVVLAMLAPALPVPAADDAAAVLRSVLDRLPVTPLSISGNMTVRKRHGVVARELLFDMALRWGSAPAVAQYTIRDSFGSQLEQLTVTRAANQPPKYEYSRGNPLQPAALPDLGAAVQETDLSWLDLSLSFLWWTDGTIAGREVVRGRQCIVLDVVPPPGAGVPYVRARLWIDEEIRMLLQAEAYGANGEAARRLWVRSVKKLNDKWMIKDMDVESYPLLHRTKLTILETKDE